MKKGIFITVEGVDGSGKSTQVRIIGDYLKEKGYEPVLTKDPGGTFIGDLIRNILLDAGNRGMHPLTEMLLFTASRVQLVMEVIKPALEEGKAVICDRFIDSSVAYQGFGRGMDIDAILEVNKPVTDILVPDITFFLDIPPEEAFRRKARGAADRMEREKEDFYLKVYEGYKKLSSMFPDRIKTIDASLDAEGVARQLKAWLDKILAFDKA